MWSENNPYRKVSSLKLIFQDLLGNLHELDLPGNRTMDVIENGVMIDSADVNGVLSICEEEYQIKPDMTTAEYIADNNNDQAILKLKCDVCNSEGSNIKNDVPKLLEVVYQNAKKLGFSFLKKEELDHFLFPENSIVVPLMAGKRNLF